MSTATERLLDEARRLSPDEQEELALCLLEGLEDPDPDAEALWAAEIQRRIAQIESGAVKPIPGREVLKMMEAAVRGERRLPTDGP